MAVTSATFGFQKFISIQSQGLGPIKRPLTASFDSNIRKTLKMRIKLKQGETPTSRSLRKLPKSGTYVKPSPRRAVLLLVPKTFDDRIVRISREKSDLLSLQNLHFCFCKKSSCFTFFFSWFNEGERSYTLFCLLMT